ncbi:MAG: hypothetical protein HC834_08045 [Rhodospirillales bacterium]|nr:hypothetical protein [Rhodospirillales bacterium]
MLVWMAWWRVARRMFDAGDSGRATAGGAEAQGDRTPWQVVRYAVSLAVALIVWMAASSSDALAVKRHAFVVGISKYAKDSGLPRLQAPVHDAEALRDVLQGLRKRFEVTLVTDKEAPNKAAFQTLFNQFLERVAPGDEVLFYFSGHGNYVEGPDKNKHTGNLYLLPDAKSEAGFLKGLSNAELRELETTARQSQRYQEWLSTVALVEADIETAIQARRPDVVLMIADACRSLTTGTKGAVVTTIGGVRLPQNNPRGTYRLYSASVGQISLDAPEPVSQVARNPSGSTLKTARTDDDDDDGDGDGKRKKGPTNSLFTKALLAELTVPDLQFEVMAAQVKVTVRTQAGRLGFVQIPDFTGNPGNTGYIFAPADLDDQLAEVCRSADAEIARLRAALTAGSLGRSALLRHRYELSRCGLQIARELDALVRLEAQGAGGVTGTTDSRTPPLDPNDPTQLCEVQASSPHDADTPRKVEVDVLREISIRTLSNELSRADALAKLQTIQAACEKLLNDRPLVARFNYLAGRVHQTIASATEGIEQQNALAIASAYFQRAADRGYGAAFNDLAMLHKDGQFYAVSGGTAQRMPANRDMALELLKRGASLRHPVAQYNLGMAFLNGDLGAQLDTDGRTIETAAARYAKAFEHLAAAAERGFLPALIETARLHFWGNGVPENEARAFELLEIAASRGRGKPCT